ncbi:MAG: glyoxalase/bleomycin resistance/extradiol dioxygenase family protein [Pseudomonadota bacterium]|nr:glyoxalase/bleomycin resistance/extradiol dioxygenase family protein [Pseudomonadota bacterium]MDQ3160561.1 glyoxalase/bleomycin resistance/extradiol dioxygenase family protein [Pseudomonadota bacterium]
MPRNLYVNLPVKDLERSVDFFAALGFSFNPMFTDENAAALIINDNTSVMLLAESFFATFTNKTICNAHESTEALLALSLDSRAEVDDFVAKALAAGAREEGEATDHGFMYERGFVDLDGHNWGPFWMDVSQFPAK